VRQRRPADQIILVAREDDAPTHAVIRRAQSEGALLTPVMVGAGGTVAALNAGLAVANADIIAFTDDDAAPRPGWLEHTSRVFACDETVGGVGGRDWVYDGARLESGRHEVVGRLQWFGRCIGNHHLGFGKPREVHFLKGVNMSFRRTAIDSLRFDTRLRGTGAQVGNDMAFSLAVRQRGWKLIYDPAAAVDHYAAPRFDEDQRRSASPLAVQNAAFNNALIVCEAIGPIRAWFFLVWAVIVGSRGSPGWLQAVRLMTTGRSAFTNATAAVAGTVAGWRMAVFRR
jgi:cellulose synthase/poly-beta-1,6-N-acetylglucosamine synthase-like glycosyltransferase